MSRTWANCHSSRFVREEASVAVISLLFPGVTVIVIPQRLPKASLVRWHEAKPAQPFCALPKIEMRDQQASGAAMGGRNWQAVVSSSNHALPADQVSEWAVCRIAAVTMSHDIGLGRPGNPDCVQKIVERN